MLYNLAWLVLVLAAAVFGRPAGAASFGVSNVFVLDLRESDTDPGRYLLKVYGLDAPIMRASKLGLVSETKLPRGLEKKGLASYYVIPAERPSDGANVLGVLEGKLYFGSNRVPVTEVAAEITDIAQANAHDFLAVTRSNELVLFENLHLSDQTQLNRVILGDANWLPRWSYGPIVKIQAIGPNELLAITQKEKENYFVTAHFNVATQSMSTTRVTKLGSKDIDSALSQETTPFESNPRVIGMPVGEVAEPQLGESYELLDFKATREVAWIVAGVLGKKNYKRILAKVDLASGKVLAIRHSAHRGWRSILGGDGEAESRGEIPTRLVSTLSPVSGAIALQGTSIGGERFAHWVFDGNLNFLGHAPKWVGAGKLARLRDEAHLSLTSRARIVLPDWQLDWVAGHAISADNPWFDGMEGSLAVVTKSLMGSLKKSPDPVLAFRFRQAFLDKLGPLERSYSASQIVSAINLSIADNGAFDEYLWPIAKRDGQSFGQLSDAELASYSDFVFAMRNLGLRLQVEPVSEAQRSRGLRGGMVVYPKRKFKVALDPGYPNLFPGAKNAHDVADLLARAIPAKFGEPSVELASGSELLSGEPRKTGRQRTLGTHRFGDDYCQSFLDVGGP